MSNAADREVQLNFLDEVDEYLNTIESVLIGLAETGIELQQMDAALRAGHTIKGIGSMIECPSLSHLAHRFEDSLKIVQARKGSIQVDAALEMLLLQGVDSMHQISSLHRQALPITESWLADHAYPVFEKLHNRLGDIQPSDELALLAEESEDDAAVVMFETEVEELLERLTAVLANPDLPCLEEELELMVEELHDLGKMLQIDAFISLCESIQRQLATAAPNQIEPIARQALELWQRSQALVVIGQFSKLPTHLEFHQDTIDETVMDIKSSLEAMPIPLSLGEFSDVGEMALEINLEASLEASLETSLEASLEASLDNLFLGPDIDAASDDIDHDAILTHEVTEALVADDGGSGDFNIPDSIPSNEILIEPAFAELPLATPPGSSAADLTADPMAEDNTIGALESIDLAGIEAAIENFDPVEFQLDVTDTPDYIDPPISPDIQNYTDPPSSSSVDTIDSAADSSITSETEIEASTEATSSGQIEFSLSPQPQAFPEDPLELLLEPLKVDPAAKTQELQENTVRVPIKRLTQLNDLFGELIIQRNTMNSRLEQMEDLMHLFAQRMGSLEGTNSRLQTFCNQIAVDTSSPTVRSGKNAATIATAKQSQIDEASDGSQDEFDSLELDRYSDLHLLSQEQRETLVQMREVRSDVKLSLREIKQASSNLNRTAKALQINVTRARMRPLADIVERFPRTVRDLSLQYGKTVDLKISGGSTLIDRFVAVHLRDPLIHLLRNAFDHGIEDTETRLAQGKPPQGTIEIRAAHRGNQTLISISDDGAGINLNKIRDRACQMGLNEELLDSMSQADLLGIIFEPGFSTAEQVTNLSGRGIGMDVVRTNLEEIRSDIKVDTQPGLGTTFTISVPFTLSIMRVLLVESGGMRLAFPTDGIEEMIRLKTVQVFESPDQKVINWQGLTVPLIHLDQWLEFRCPPRSIPTEITPIINEPSILIINQGNRLSGIYIDRFWGEREVVIRQVENVISLPPGFNGCTILEDGQVVPLADASKLLEWIDKDKNNSGPNSSQYWQNLLQAGSDPEPPQQLALPQIQQTTVMVVDDSINMRQLLRTTLEQEGYRVEQGRDGQDAVDQLLSGVSVHAIVCDIEMPRLDGYGLLAEVRADAKLKDLPVIMLTSRSSDKHRQLAMRLGATDYITKPYQDHELLHMIEQVLQQPTLSTV